MEATVQTFPPIGNVGNTPPMPLHQFLTVQPKALGTVQIMIGVVTLLFGIVLVTEPAFAPVSVISGIVYWGSIVYIITGSLSVAAENKLHPCAVQGSLGMNVVSAVFSAVAIGLLTGDLIMEYYCYPYENCSMIVVFQERSKAISGVLLVFAVLQFLLSIVISALACKATCCTEPMVSVVAYTNQAVTGHPQNLMYVPQSLAHTNTSVPQNTHLHQWPQSK